MIFIFQVSVLIEVIIWYSQATGVEIQAVFATSNIFVLLFCSFKKVKTQTGKIF